jgi:trehalose utilization protein
MQHENKVSMVLDSLVGLKGGEVFHQILASKGVEYVCEYFIASHKTYPCFMQLLSSHSRLPRGRCPASF